MSDEEQAEYRADPDAETLVQSEAGAPPRDVAAELALRAGWLALRVFGLPGPDPLEPLAAETDAATRGMAAFCRREPDAPEEALYRHQAPLEERDPGGWDHMAAGEKAVWILYRAVLRTLDDYLPPAPAEAAAPAARAPVPVDETIYDTGGDVFALSDTGKARARRDAAADG